MVFLFVNTFRKNLIMQKVRFKSKLEKLGNMGEKTGWTIAEIPFEIAEKLNPNVKTSYRIKGTIDEILKISQKSILPMGEGNFILPFDAAMRKALKKSGGSEVVFDVEVDTGEFQYSVELIEALDYEDRAKDKFYSLPKSHQKYYSNWVESAKTIETKTRRIAMCVNGLAKGMEYGEMIRYYKNLKV